MARLGGGFSHWTSITAGGVTEAMISAITNDGVGAATTAAVPDKIDGFVKEAGGTKRIQMVRTGDAVMLSLQLDACFQ